MMRSTHLRIGAQLRIFVAAMLLSVLGLATWSWLRIDDLWQQTEGLYDHPLAVSQALAALESDTLALHRITNHLCDGAPLTDKKLHEIEARRVDLLAQVDILRDRYLGPPEDVEDLQAALLRWNTTRAEILHLLREGRVAEAAARRIASGASDGDVVSVRRQLAVIRTFAKHRAAQYYHQVEQHRRWLEVELGLLLTVALALGVAIYWQLLRGIRGPIAELTATTERFRAGDLGARSSHVSGNELGALSASFNTMADAIRLEAELNAHAAEVTRALLLDDELQRFCDDLLRVLIERTGSQMGAIHLLDSARERYDHLASIGLSEAGRRSFSAQAREGELGAALVTRRIQRIADLPEDTRFVFNAVSGTIVPRELVAIPVATGTTVVAVITLASLPGYTPATVRLLEEVQAVLTTRFNAVLANERVRKLVEQLDEQNRELAIQKRELSTRTRELSAQNIELSAQKQQLNEADRLKNAFMANMSHELRTPLNSVIALSGVLKRRLASTIPGDLLDYLDVIERNGQSLLSLINDILDLARIEGGHERIELAPTSPAALARDVLALFEVPAQQKNIQLTSEVSSDLPSLQTDPDKCRHVLQNLVANAVKFTDHGQVTVRAELAPDSLNISVQDTGIGISKDDLEIVFDEFRQTDSGTARKYGGTGLGLAIARRYARLLGGEVTARSELGHGSTFTLSLPRVAPPGETSPPARTSQDEVHSAASGRSKSSQRHLLLVEDNVAAVAQLTDLLGSHGYRVDVAHDGQEALDFLEHSLPDGAVVDLTMPGVDGFELLQSMRAKQRTAELPVLILTARYVTRDELAVLRENHVRQLIRKGDVNAEGLLAAVADLVGGKRHRSRFHRSRAQPLVLVVEDNLDNLRTARALLDTTFDVIEAQDGQDAVTKAQEHEPDVILMDLGLPVMDGLQALRRIRELPALAGIPVIAVTASAMSGDREKILQAGFSAYVSKPIDYASLMRILDALLAE